MTPVNNALNQAVEFESVASVEKALASLLVTCPESWRAAVQRLAALPDPARSTVPASTLASRSKKLADAAQKLGAQGIADAATVRWLTSLALELTWAGQTFEDLRAFLKTLRFFDDSVPTQTFRLAILIENQARSGQKLALERGRVGDSYHPYAVIDDFLATPAGGHTSIVRAYEGMVEAIELVLRYSHHLAGKKARSGPLHPNDPFSDPDLERALRAAGVWKSAQDCLGAVRFGGWTTHTGCDHACLVPPDIAEHQRRRVGELREQAIQAQFLPQEILSRDHSDTLQAIEALGRTLVLPARGQVWNGQFDRGALDAAAQDTVLFDLVTQWTQFRHFERYAATVSVPPQSLPWTTWLRAVNRLHVFAHAVAHRAHPDPATTPSDLGAAILIMKPSDVALLLRADGVDEDAAAAAVVALTFDPRRRSLELWDHPLLPLTEELVLLVPGLVTSASPIRMLENAVAEWGENAPGMRGPPFEKRTVQDISALCPGQAQSPVIFDDSDGRSVECDVVWWWDGTLFLIETKCLKSAHSDAELLGDKVDIEEAFSQLRRRRAAVRREWGRFRAAATECGLPVECPDDERIATVALSNVLYFTGWSTSDGIATDDVVFRRYFGEAEVTARQVGRDAGTVFLAQIGRIRDAPISPGGFLEYLRSPPQCSSMASKLVPTLTNTLCSRDDFPLWKLSLKYSPDLTRPEAADGGGEMRGAV